MDVNDLRIIVTLLSLGVFLALLFWVLRPRNAPGFAEAAQIPFAAGADEPRP